MPKSFILNYVEDKMVRGVGQKTPGPVVTIAREYGCPGMHIAQQVAAGLSQKGPDWKMVDREVIEQAANELGVSIDEADRISRSGPPGFFQNLISGFAQQQNPGDAAVKRRIAQVIRAVALAGNVVILGRGGVVITRDVKHSLHVKLYAPLTYRTERVRKMDQLGSDREAHEKMAAVDRERIYLRDYFAGEVASPDIFDIQFNCARLSEAEIVGAIVAIALDKFRNI
ncbi:MAG: cytidylate kinase-like family protein [Leptospirales bacterium]|nr:cytidylate kinase-like family protein [Leptospirales bacterium]